MKLSFGAKVSLVGLVAMALIAQELVAGWSGAIIAAALLAALAVVLFLVFTEVAGRLAPDYSYFETALEGPATPSRRPTDLEAFERSFGWAVYQPSEVRYRLKPVLDEIARLRSPLAGADTLLDLVPEGREVPVRTEEIVRLVEQIERMR